MTMRADSSKRLTIFTEAEKLALYGLPDFDDFQRAEFFAFNEEELALADRRRGDFERLHCLLQLGYFKAKHAFFGLTTDMVPTEDIGFVAERYFPDVVVPLRPLRPSELYAQRAEIARLFGFRLWSEVDRPALVEVATELARRDVTPSFIGLELLGVLKDRKIVRPGYTTLQSVIGTALTVERKRLDHLVEAALDAQTIKTLRDLLVRERTLTDLAALAELKKDARNEYIRSRSCSEMSTDRRTGSRLTISCARPSPKSPAGSSSSAAPNSTSSSPTSAVGCSLWSSSPTTPSCSRPCWTGIARPATRRRSPGCRKSRPSLGRTSFSSAGTCSGAPVSPST
jgi:Domain of unknown function (DUF4158)